MLTVVLTKMTSLTFLALHYKLITIIDDNTNSNVFSCVYHEESMGISDIILQ